MRQVTLNNVQGSPVWNEVKNWSNDQKYALITLLYTTMDDDVRPNVKNDNETVYASELSPETLSACVEMALKDHESGRAIPHSTLMERIKVQRGWE